MRSQMYEAAGSLATFSLMSKKPKAEVELFKDYVAMRWLALFRRGHGPWMWPRQRVIDLGHSDQCGQPAGEE